MDTGGNLFEKLSDGIVDVSNVTLSTTSTIAKGISHIFDWIGGTPNFILFLINGAIIIYLIVDYNWRKRSQTNPNPFRTVIDLKDSAQGAEPPIPTKPPLYSQNANMSSSQG